MARKDDHIALALDERQQANEQRFWDAVHLPHCALPELDFQDVNVDIAQPCGNHGPAVMVVGMTGGTVLAEQINADVAYGCAKLGIPMGLGSIRPYIQESIADGYDLVPNQPGLRLYGNLGGTQLAQMRASGEINKLNDIVSQLQLAAFCIHLNPAQELIQPEGDRDFRGVLDAIAQVRAQLSCPVVVKETGAGINAKVAQQLLDVGIEWIDVSGVGGTSWTAIENFRNPHDRSLFDQWGIPTPLAVADCARTQAQLIASGGIRSGLDAARAVALGAQMVGIARPVLSAQNQDGAQGVLAYLERFVDDFKTALLLCGAQNVAQMSKVGCSLSEPLAGRNHI